VFVVLLVVIIVAALIFVAKRAGIMSSGLPPPPKAEMDRPVEFIDMKNLTVITRTLGEWMKLGRGEYGRYKNPDTGEYTMVPPMTCAACGAKIPPPPPVDPNAKPGERPPPAEMVYKCPKCTKLAFPSTGTNPAP
jgi:hypothetical protein